MDYSSLDSEAKENLAERIAMVAVQLWELEFMVQGETPTRILFQALSELKTLVNELGGHPATDVMP